MISVKHVAIVVKYFPSVSETFIINQINSLLDKGVKVSLFAFRKVDTTIIHQSLIKHNLLDKVQYFINPPVNKGMRLLVFFKWTLKHFFSINWRLFFKSLNVIKYGKDAYTLKLFFEAQWFLIPYKFNLIHAHFGINGNRIAYLKAYGIIPKQVKLINTFHGYDLMPNQLNHYKEEYKYLLKEANAFTVNTPYLESLLGQINIFNKHSFILPVGLDTSFFKQNSIKKHTEYFDMVFCGKLILLKGPDLAIDILNQLHELGHTQVRLHMIGNGQLRKLLEKQAKSLNLMEHVYFYGALSQKDIIHRFEQTDVFLLPGRYDRETGRAETQGLVIQEAQSMGLPVVVSDVGGMKYGLLPNESGFIIEEGDINNFAKAIEKLILTPNLKNEMGKMGRKFVKLNYDNKGLVKKLLDIYKNTVNR
jgi:colanic acid/amylovoran biosynthesis glycosyltransferase